MGIVFLNKRLRQPIYAIYGFVRFADEIVDSFEGYDRSSLLADFKKETYKAIEQGISLNPILNTFQHAVNEYHINHELIETFFQSMEMDLDKVTYSKELYDKYILGSAEVVGLMCLHVFTEGNSNQFQILKPYAMKLGSAFQKINFLRDLQADYTSLGRTYFPDVDMRTFSRETKRQIEQDIEQDFKLALAGIKQLPASSRGGVYLAYVYYHALFRKIKNVPAKQMLNQRIRISNMEKLRLMINSMFQYKLNLI
jgi:phytoene/squalene synthetase